VLDQTRGGRAFPRNNLSREEDAACSASLNIFLLRQAATGPALDGFELDEALYSPRGSQSVMSGLILCVEG
jgi:hypothetical protein